MPAHIDILSPIREVVDLDEQGRPRITIEVSFKVGEDGPFVERIPKAEFSPLALRARLQEFAQKLDELRSM